MIKKQIYNPNSTSVRYVVVIFYHSVVVWFIEEAELIYIQKL